MNTQGAATILLNSSFPYRINSRIKESKAAESVWGFQSVLSA
jgi:hypothetical protein